MWMICENLRGFTTSRPPLVIFVLSLGAFAIVLLTLAYLVKVNELKNPDERDWNTFLDGFKQLEFCMVNEDYDVSNITKEHVSQKEMADVLNDIHSNIQGLQTTSPSTADLDRIISVSVPVWANVKPTSDFVNIPHNLTHLRTTMIGKQFGVKGTHASTEFNVTLTLPFTWNSSLCKSGEMCKTVMIHTCVNLRAPARFFPKTRVPDPYSCQMLNNSGGVENHFQMVSQQRSGSQHVEIICNSKPSFTLDHKTESGLNIMLSLQDRSAINLHLMHTTYFLFVMVVTMMCYALIKGKPSTSNKPVQYTEVSHA